MAASFAPRPGRLALFLEGGYNPASLEASTEATLGALGGTPSRLALPGPDGGRPRHGRATGGASSTANAP